MPGPRAVGAVAQPPVAPAAKAGVSIVSAATGRRSVTACAVAPDRPVLRAAPIMGAAGILGRPGDGAVVRPVAAMAVRADPFGVADPMGPRFRTAIVVAVVPPVPPGAPTMAAVGIPGRLAVGAVARSVVGPAGPAPPNIARSGAAVPMGPLYRVATAGGVSLPVLRAVRASPNIAGRRSSSSGRAAIAAAPRTTRQRH